MLQWSRASKSPETVALWGRSPPAVSGFNGAGLRRARRRPRWCSVWRRPRRCFNGAGLRRARRPCADASRAWASIAASMEPGFEEPGDMAVTMPLGPLASLSFNGAGLRRARRPTHSNTRKISCHYKALRAALILCVTNVDLVKTNGNRVRRNTFSLRRRERRRTKLLHFTARRSDCHKTTRTKFFEVDYAHASQIKGHNKVTPCGYREVLKR